MGLDNIQFSKPSHARWQVVHRAEDVHVVYQPDGTIYGTFASKSQAAAIVGRKQKEADAAARRIVRPCMCCQREFQSEGIHNRLCDVCRRQGGAYDPHGIAPRSGRPR